MPDEPLEPELITLTPTTTAVLRERVPMTDLTAFFDRAFHASSSALERQGIAVIGPPFAVYFDMPTDSVDIAAGFPVEAPIASEGGVSTLELPGGRAVRLVHRGSYDSLRESYDRIFSWLAAQHLVPGALMWETYLTEPMASDPTAQLTEITWPLATDAPARAAGGSAEAAAL